ncbi:MAG: hypothetical protein A2381_05740 [Bdellovibrionales bacterium RIFOXYB1_FULL_37_110]|nr:MAG: hypothetical protein A2417_06355 [Bdellovibrionales bacterium RIFOXYC1_FULL_37_79]OFZ57683.1 MAG: hypothetical protein A2328_06895 [Bdellovibrionales bacterium RIFOXYB2_FULL_36_6]OFZ58559.1 MAG: hypothetical protein A2381_05740 [Bdellovibrionales bacterium RIFOXYB1_FULL_37_110]OFZ63784.1 MAG: hypothetical protein A2577_07490 [Bdellovibrionales bacterium RIFOXYD1_FULL_36_51]
MDLSARLVSTISSIQIQEGMEVKANDELIRLSCEDTKLAFDQIERDYKRGDGLFRQGVLAKEDYEHLTHKFNEAKMKWDWCIIVSPIDGFVLHINKEIGEYVTPGTKLITVADLKNVYANIYVEGSKLLSLKPGMEVEIIVDHTPTKKITGNIAFINQEAEFTPKNVQTKDERTRLVHMIKINLKNESLLLKPGMSIEVNLN